MKKSYHFSTYRTMPAATLRAMMRNWVDTYVRPRRREFDEHWDSHAIFDEALKVLMIDIGWQKAFIPPEFGGWGAGNVANIGTFCTVVFEEMSRGDLGMNIAFASGYWSQLMIAMKPDYNLKLLTDMAPFALSKDKLYFGGLFSGFYQFGVAGQTQVIVRRKVNIFFRAESYNTRFSRRSGLKLPQQTFPVPGF